MVSNVLGMDQDDLVELLKTFKKKYADDAEYREARGVLPKGWPF
jgi:hypothetical protein